MTIIIAVGWEKLIPTPIEEVAAVTGRFSMDISMGIPVGLIPITGKVVTETDAISILAEVKATVIGGGGIQGAEGSTTFVLEGNPAEIKKSWEIISAIKDASLSGQADTLVECERGGTYVRAISFAMGNRCPSIPRVCTGKKTLLKRCFLNIE